jgi:hypothetical protein
MTAKLILIGTLFFAHQSLAQQTITSKGDQNININIGTMNVTPQVSEKTKKALQKATREALGPSEHWDGVLLPALDKSPASICKSLEDGGKKSDPESSIQISIPTPTPKELKNSITVRIGRNDFVCERSMCSVIRTAYKNLIWISRKNGLLMIEAKILTTDGIIIATIENNQFFVNRNQTYRRPIRADASSLQVFDERGDSVLSVRFINKKMLVLEGIFNDGHGNEMKINKENISIKKGVSMVNYSGNCNRDPSQTLPSDPGWTLGDFFLGGNVPESSQ